MENFQIPDYEILPSFLFRVGSLSSFMPLLIIIGILTVLAINFIEYRYRSSLWKRSNLKGGESKFSSRFINATKLLFFGKATGTRIFGRIYRILLFAAVVTLILLYLALMLDVLLIKPVMNTTFIQGYYYYLWSIVVNCAAIVLFFLTIVSIYLRLIVRPAYLRTNKTDMLFLFGMMLFFVALIINDALRIAIMDRPVYESGFFAAYAVSWFFKNSDPVLLENYYIAGWTISLLLAVILILLSSIKRSFFSIYLPIHLLNTKPVSLQQKNFYNPKEIIPLKKSGFGQNRLSDFSSDLLRSTDACTECGKCDEKCPAMIAELPLSPKAVIGKLNLLLEKKEAQLSDYINADELFSCFDCGLCTEVCPSGVDPLSVITGLKRHYVLEKGQIPPPLGQLFRTMNHTSASVDNCYKAKSLNDSELPYVQDDIDFDYLLFAGCNYSFDPDKYKNLKFLIKLFLHHGIKVAVLGKEECCCGDAALRGGETALFEKMGKNNLRVFEKYKIKKIITVCAHGYHTLKNEYPILAQSEKLPFPEVFHYTEIIRKLIEEEILVFKKSINKNIAFHDPCYLGRFNDMYKTHRVILDSIPGVHITEMRRSGPLSVCCGASGAVNNFEKRKAYKLGEFRAMDAYSNGAHLVTTACPFCYDSISEGVKDINQQGIDVCDIIALLSMSIDEI